MPSKSPEAVKKIKDPVSVALFEFSKCVFIVKVCTRSTCAKGSTNSSISTSLNMSTSIQKNLIIIHTCS